MESGPRPPMKGCFKNISNLIYVTRKDNSERKMLNRNENASIRIESQNKCPNSKITDLA